MQLCTQRCVYSVSGDRRRATQQPSYTVRCCDSRLLRIAPGYGTYSVRSCVEVSVPAFRLYFQPFQNL